MENYNRLFLLQEQEPAEGEHDDAVALLKDQIMKGEDVTDPIAKTGKVTLSQINTYSGEVDIAALTNFKAVKLDSVTGNVYETNLAKLLIELQQVGGIEDRREEALIEHASIQRDVSAATDDNELDRKAAATWMPDGLHFLADDINDYNWTAPSAEDVQVIYPVEIDYKAPHSFVKSQLDPNGTRRSFIASFEDGFGYGKDRLIVSLNGIVQDENDGEYLSLLVDNKEVIYGFEFNEAPVEGDEIYFMFDDIVQHAISHYSSVSSAAEAFSAETKSHFENGVKADYDSATAMWQEAIDKVSITAATEDLLEARKTLKEAEKAIETAETEGEISNALTASTDAYIVSEGAAGEIIRGNAEIGINSFRLNASGPVYAQSDLRKEEILKELGGVKEAADKTKVALQEMLSNMTEIENDDETGGQS